MVKFKDLEKKLKKYDIDKIKDAYLYALDEHKDIKRLTGEDYITHPLEVANILIDLNVDQTTIICALLHETINNGNATYEVLKENFGEEVAHIVDIVSKINKLELQDDTESSAAYLRKILVGMADDVRVLYIKLADRLHNMRTNWAVNPKKQKRKAKETINILVPIAHRLGMNGIKSELENLCLQYLKPEVYSDIVEKLNATVEELTHELNNMKENISELLEESNLKFEIKGRVKSIYSIYQKLLTGRTWDDIYDILALRVFVNKESECYTAVGLIHSKYRPIAKRFKDYVASPKSNLYQSLHTTVFGDNGKLYEVQIRTYEMDEIAEKGIASHWSYKEKGSRKIQTMMEQKLEMFRTIIEANNESSDSDFEKVLENDFFTETIYVYTPKGDVVELPKGASPIDFAYRIHSYVGDTTVGAIVNDKIVSFSYELQDGDIVKINTSNTGKPNKEWLNIVKTSQAKNKIKSYFSKEFKADYIIKGKAYLEKELRKRHLAYDEVLSTNNLSKILRDLKLESIDDLFLAVGSLRYTSGYIINLATEDKTKLQDNFIDKDKRKQNYKKTNKGDIIVNGEKNILINFAGCCNPVKGEKIIGYITKGQGITIHRYDCDNVDPNSERVLEVEWNYETDNSYNTKIYILVSQDKNILPSLIETATKQNINIFAFNTIYADDKTIYEINVRVKSMDNLEGYMNQIMRINNVKNVSKKMTDL